MFLIWKKFDFGESVKIEILPKLSFPTIDGIFRLSKIMKNDTLGS